MKVSCYKLSECVHVETLKKPVYHETVLQEGGKSCIFRAKFLYLIIFCKVIKTSCKMSNCLDPIKILFLPIGWACWRHRRPRLQLSIYVMFILFSAKSYALGLCTLKKTTYKVGMWMTHLVPPLIFRLANCYRVCTTLCTGNYYVVWDQRFGGFS